jgi:hypothetical protein
MVAVQYIIIYGNENSEMRVTQVARARMRQINSISEAMLSING